MNNFNYLNKVQEDGRRKRKEKKEEIRIRKRGQEIRKKKKEITKRAIVEIEKDKRNGGSGRCNGKPNLQLRLSRCIQMYNINYLDFLQELYKEGVRFNIYEYAAQKILKY